MRSEPEFKNALITGTALGNEDHGIFTASLVLEYESGCQCFGGYAMDEHNGVRGAGSRRRGTAYGMEFILRILDTVGADSWEKLKGKCIRVKATQSKVIAIGHITKDKWFNPEEDLKGFIAE